jgi:DNA-binding CsgD family transcriptional regulator
MRLRLVWETDRVLPKRGEYGRAKRRLEAVPASTDAIVEAFLTSVSDLLDLDSSCWHESDPASGSPVYGAVLSKPLGSFMESMQYEFRRRDVNTFADLTRDRGSYGLSPRDRDIAALLVQGQSAKSIASALIISPWTVQDHIKAIYRKTGVGARSDLASLAAGAGWN